MTDPLGKSETQEPQLLIEPIIAWRSWGVEEGHLTSPVRRYPWHDGTMGADLSADACRCGSLYYKNEQCVCGVNAYATRRLLMSSPYCIPWFMRCACIGEVALSGEVRGFRDGWRAETGQIKRVWAVTRWHAKRVREAADASGVQYMGVAPWRWRLDVQPLSLVGVVISFIVLLIWQAAAAALGATTLVQYTPYLLVGVLALLTMLRTGNPSLIMTALLFPYIFIRHGLLG